MLILIFLLTIAISCNRQRPEEIEVTTIVTNCDYVKHISNIIKEIQKIEEVSTKESSEVNSSRLKLLHNKLYEIIDYASSNGMSIDLCTNCEGFDDLKDETISIKLFERGMKYLNPVDYKKSYLYFNLAKLTNKSNDEFLHNYFVKIFNHSRDSLSKNIANLSNIWDIINENGDKEIFSAYDYNSTLANVLSISASKQDDIILGEFEFFKLNKSYYRILLPKGFNEMNSEGFSGMAFFKPLLMNNFKHISYNRIKNISTEELYKMVSSNSFQDFFRPNKYYSVYYWLNLTYADQLVDIYDNLNKLDKYTIDSRKEEFISALIKLKEQYSIAEYNYRQKKFLIYGTCYANEKDYDINNQSLKMTLFLENSYLCDLYANIPYEDAKSLFSSSKTQKGAVEFIVSPGSGYTYFTSSPYYEDAITELQLLEESNIVFKTSNGEIKFITQDYKGKPLWSGAKEWWRTIQGMNYPDNRIKVNAKKI